MAPKRSSVAGNTPPIIMSQISVVVTSMTPDSSRESTSFSMDWPPMPVAWNTRQSYSPLSWAVTCCTHVVVTPNMVRPTAGRPSAARRWAAARASARRCLTMPAIACAPLASTWREMELSPCTSVTEYIIMMSEGPT